MKEYEIVAKYCNGCAGDNHPEISFEEAELENPDDFVRAKHGQFFEHFRKELLPNGRILYTCDTGGVKYSYEFTEI